MKMTEMWRTFCALTAAAAMAVTPVSVHADDVISGVTASAGDASADVISGVTASAGDASADVISGVTASAGDASADVISGVTASAGDASADVVTTSSAGEEKSAEADVEETCAETDGRSESAAVSFAEEVGDILDALTTLSEQDLSAASGVEARVIRARSAFEALSPDEQTLLGKTKKALDNAEISATNAIIVFGGEVPDGAVSVWNEGMKDRPNSYRYSNGVEIDEEKTDVIRETAAVQALADGKDFSFAQAVADGTESYGNAEGLVGANVTTWEDHEDYAQHFGIDVSSWQGEIDWEAVKDAGVEFAIIRCGYGSNETDDSGDYIQDDARWEYNASECERLGIPYGVYLYSYATDVTMIHSEVEHIKRLLEGRTPTLPIFLDMEDTSQAALGADKVSEFAEEYVAEMTDEGYTAGIYSNTQWWTTYLARAAEDEENGELEYCRWVAQWNTEVTYDGTFTVWQYTSRGAVDGITGNADLNYWYGTLEGGSSSPNSQKVSVYRLFNKKTGEHLYTLDRNERNTLSAAGWTYEGIGWYAPKVSNTPVYRVYNPTSGEHVYTTDLHEKQVLSEQYHWNFEGICWYSDDSETVPVYREFNSKATGSFPHNYTADSHEHSVLTTQYGWNDEGVAWYGIAK